MAKCKNRTSNNSDPEKKGYLLSKICNKIRITSGSTYYTIYSKLNPVIDYQNKFHLFILNHDIHMDYL